MDRDGSFLKLQSQKNIKHLSCWYLEDRINETRNYELEHLEHRNIALMEKLQFQRFLSPW